MKLPRSRKIWDRRELICNIIKGTNVLHVGCTDAPFTYDRINNNNLLHQQMMESASRVVGIDINEEGIKIMRKKGIKNVFVSDIYKICENDQLMKNYDYIVMSEVLEHLPNAGLAIEEIKKYIINSKKSSKLIITVPNVNSYFQKIIDFLLNRESVHPDHLCYYSFSTIKTLLEAEGFEIIDIKYVSYGLGSLFKPVAYCLNLFSSSFLPSIFVLAKVKNDLPSNN